MKKFIFIASIVLTTLATSCNKNCHCYGFDGSHAEFTEQQVDSLDYGNCSNIALYYGNGRYYSICEWD